jgi:signal recognition particle GTPase
MFAGREKELQLLQEAMYDRSIINSRVQKRFVVYGLGGSGKTEFCCKFALENRQR